MIYGNALVPSFASSGSRRKETSSYQAHSRLRYLPLIILENRRSNVAKHALKIFFHATRQQRCCFPEELRQPGINRRQIGGMIQRLAIDPGEWMEDLSLRQMLVRRIRLHQQTIRRHVFERFPLAQLPFLQKVTGKAEIRSELGERRDHFHRPAITMQHETTLWTRILLQQLQHPSPCLQTMDASRHVASGRHAQLRQENLLLPVVSQVRLPAVQTNLTHGAGYLIQQFLQAALPVRRAFTQIPRMITEAPVSY